MNLVCINEFWVVYKENIHIDSFCIHIGGIWALGIDTQICLQFTNNKWTPFDYYKLQIHNTYAKHSQMETWQPREKYYSQMKNTKCSCSKLQLPWVKLKNDGLDLNYIQMQLW
jgi:hypothetical protein